MDFIVEEWRLEDLPEMLDIWNEVVKDGQAFPQESGLNGRTGQDYFERQSFCGVARDKESPGIAGLYILHPNNIGRCGHISNASYAVSKRARGKGIGEKLVRHSLMTARNLGFRILQFNAVVSENIAANSLYQKLGFTKLGTIPQGFKNPNDIYKDINIYYFDLNKFGAMAKDNEQA